MNSSLKGWVTLAGGVASIVVLTTSMCHGDLFAPAEETERERASYDFQPFSDTYEPPPEPPEGESRWIRFVDDNEDSIEANTLVSAPGMWPFVSIDSDEAGYLELPANTVERFRGDELRMYEIIARSADRDGDGHGFWGLVRGPDGKVEPGDAPMVQMQQGYAVELTVVDDAGMPIEGAYVRLAQDTVGLVHLDYTTRADGRATFSALPPDTYYLTVDADGYRRTTVTVDHSSPMETPMSIALDDGGGLRTPYAWRGPPVQQAAGGGGSSSSGATGSSASGSSDGGGASSSGGQSTAGDDAVDSTGGDGSTSAGDEGMVEIEVRVANRRGGGVSGAWIEARAGGQRVDESASGGRDRVALQVPHGANVDLIASHAHHGEGVKSLGAVDGSEDVIVRLEADLLSDTPAEDRIVWPDEIEEELGMELVDDGSRWLIDRPASETPAAQAGIERSDKLLFVRREGAGYTAVIQRDGQPMAVEVR